MIFKLHNFFSIALQEQSSLIPPHEPFSSLLLKIKPIAMIKIAIKITRNVIKTVVISIGKFKLD